MNSRFLQELLMLATSRPDGVHIYPLDGLDQPYAADNGNAIYVFVPMTSDPEVIEALEAALEKVATVKVTSPAHNMDTGFPLFMASRLHTTRAMEYINSVFSYIIENAQAEQQPDV